MVNVCFLKRCLKNHTKAFKRGAANLHFQTTDQISAMAFLRETTICRMMPQQESNLTASQVSLLSLSGVPDSQHFTAFFLGRGSMGSCFDRFEHRISEDKLFASIAFTLFRGLIHQ